MPVKIMPGGGPVEVPTYEEFLALLHRVETLEGAGKAPRSQSGHIDLKGQQNGEFTGAVNLGWRPSRVTTSPHERVEITIRDDGFDIRSILYAAVDWTAYR